MKKILLGVLVLGAMASCKKDKKDSCESTVTAMAGSYKITKVQVEISGAPTTDFTSYYLADACDAAGVYQLKADKTAAYTTTASCSDDGTGTWDVANNKITISAGGGYSYSAQSLTSWDCTTFVISEDNGSGGTLKIYFTKQ